MRFLLRLPEPVIPINCCKAFHDPLKEFFYASNNELDDASAIRGFQRLIRTLLPPLSRQLLLYLLDLMAVFASKSEFNRMTSQHLAAIFQPAILSPVKAGGDFEEETESCQLSQRVLVFLIENQDSFLIDMA